MPANSLTRRRARKTIERDASSARDDESASSLLTRANTLGAFFGASERCAGPRPRRVVVHGVAPAMADGTDDLSQLFKDDLLGMDAGVGDAAAEEAARVALSNSMFAEDAAMEARAGRGGTPAPRARGGATRPIAARSRTRPPPRNPPPRAAPRVVPAPRPVDRDRDRRGPPRDDDRDFERDHHLDEMAQQFLDDHEHPEDEIEHQDGPPPRSSSRTRARSSPRRTPR